MKYLERRSLFDLTPMMSMTNLVAIGIKILRVNSGYYQLILEEIFY